MAEGKCDKCGAPTSNRGNMFRCGSGMVDYSSKGAKLVQTTTSVTETRHCVLCDSCINEYAENLKKGKGNYAAPIIGMILSAVIGGLFSLMGGIIRVICLLGIAAGIIILLFAGVTSKKQAIRKKTLGLFLIVVLTSLLANVVTFSEQGISLGRGPESKSTLTESREKAELGNILQGQWNDEIGSGRIGIWKTLLKTVPQHFWIGTGPGTVTDRAGIVYERYVPETGRTLKARVDNAHNEFLEYLVCEGIIGLLLYLFLIIYTVARCRNGPKAERRLLLTAMVSYWIQSFFGLGLILVLPIVFLFWGLLNQSENT